MDAAGLRLHLRAYVVSSHGDPAIVGVSQSQHPLGSCFLRILLTPPQRNMSQVYVIFGRKVPAYQISMATFGLLIGGVAWAKSGPKKAPAPAVQAESSEEDKFVTDYLKKLEKE